MCPKPSEAPTEVEVPIEEEEVSINDSIFFLDIRVRN